MRRSVRLQKTCKKPQKKTLTPRAASCAITQSQDKKARVAGATNTHNPLTTNNLNPMELIMAKPNDTRITHVPTNAAQSTTSSSTPDLTLLLQALIAQLAASQAAPKPPKSARPPRIKPRRRVTVRAHPSPAADASTPWIRLCGHWLEPAGFTLNKRVNVHVAKGFMLLIPEDES